MLNSFQYRMRDVGQKVANMIGNTVNSLLMNSGLLPNNGQLFMSW